MRKNLEHALTYGNMESEKRISAESERLIALGGKGRRDGFPEVEKAATIGSLVPISSGEVFPLLYNRLAILVDTVLAAVKSEPGDYKPNVVEELSFQWHRGRLRAEREHGTPE